MPDSSGPTPEPEAQPVKKRMYARRPDAWTRKPENREKMLAAIAKARAAHIGRANKEEEVKKKIDQIVDKKLNPKRTLSQVESVFAKEMGMKKDWAAEIAHAIFVGNRDRIYEAFSRQLFKGDSRAFNALANRAYGMPSQELSFNQDKPFKLVIEYIGEKQEPETITIEGEKVVKALVEANALSEESAADPETD